MVQHKVINLNATGRDVTPENPKINLEHVLVDSLANSEVIKFELIDSSMLTLNMKELWTAFNVLASDEFDTLTDYINEREDAYKDAQEKYNDMVKNNSFEPEDVYEYGLYMLRYGRYSTLADNMHGKIIDLVGWDSWVDASRMYESITGIPREWLG